MGKGVTKAVANVNDLIAPELLVRCQLQFAFIRAFMVPALGLSSIPLMSFHVVLIGYGVVSFDRASSSMCAQQGKNS